MNDATRAANDYLSAFYSGDLPRARQHVSDAFVFGGPMVETNSADAFFASAAPLGRIVRGHRLLRQWEDSGEVCSIFEVMLETPAGAGPVLMTEWHVVGDGRLTAGRVVFDTAAFRALVPAR